MLNQSQRMERLKRGVKNKCPRCGEGAILENIFVRHENCPHCGMQYEREQGFFSAAMAINYALICVFYFLPLLLIWLLGWLPGMVTIVLCFLGALIIPILTYRYSQCLWLGLYYFLVSEDIEGLEKEKKPDAGL